MSVQVKVGLRVGLTVDVTKSSLPFFFSFFLFFLFLTLAQRTFKKMYFCVYDGTLMKFFGHRKRRTFEILQEYSDTSMTSLSFPEFLRLNENISSGKRTSALGFYISVLYLFIFFKVFFPWMFISKKSIINPTVLVRRSLFSVTSGRHVLTGNSPGQKITLGQI